MKMGPATRIARSSSQVATGLGNGDLVLLSMVNTKYFSANPIGRRIWEHLESPKTLSELQVLILGEYAVSAAQCESDLKRFVDAMVSASLVDVVG